MDRDQKTLSHRARLAMTDRNSFRVVYPLSISRRPYVLLMTMLFLVATSTGTASAAVVYEYQGAPYFAAAPEYSPSDSVSIQITLDNDFDSNLVEADLRTEVLDYVYSDGVNVFTPGDGPPLAVFTVSTDAEGVLEEWLFTLGGVELPFPPGQVNFSSASPGAVDFERGLVCVIQTVVMGDCGFDPSQTPSLRYRAIPPGTWSQVVIPEPETVVLLGLGLLALGRRRKQTARA